MFGNNICLSSLLLPPLSLPFSTFPSFSPYLVACIFSLHFNIWNRDDKNVVRKFLEKQNELRYMKALEGRRMLPAWSCMEIVLDAVEQHQVVVISGETGCGKSTQVRLGWYNSVTIFICSWVIWEDQRQQDLYTDFQIPQFLLDSWLLNWDSANKRHVEIICTQPRRLSTIGVAERVAEERAEKIGTTVGYQVTFGTSEG
jgi:ATP-dependent RNA helicase DHX57